MSGINTQECLAASQTYASVTSKCSALSTTSTLDYLNCYCADNVRQSYADYQKSCGLSTDYDPFGTICSKSSGSGSNSVSGSSTVSRSGSSSTGSSSPTVSANASSNTGLIIGVSVGAVVLLLCVILGVWYFLRKKNTEKKTAGEKQFPQTFENHPPFQGNYAQSANSQPPIQVNHAQTGNFPNYPPPSSTGSNSTFPPSYPSSNSQYNQYVSGSQPPNFGNSKENNYIPVSHLPAGPGVNYDNSYLSKAPNMPPGQNIPQPQPYTGNQFAPQTQGMQAPQPGYGYN
ncbi:hypothetical protein HK096_004153 [Nowakowskiella sp. JEL0078]|nr:hypothetical protein HK096_004153 [Nowakowskiella sp. JEL0078]